MGIPSYGGAASYDQSAGSHLDLSDELSAVLLADVFFLGRIPVKGEAKNVDHYWIEDTLNAYQLTTTIALAAGDTALTIASNGNITVGCLLVDEAVGSAEIMQVTTVTSATALVIARAVGDSAPTAETHALGAKFRIIGQPKQEGDANVADNSKTRLRKQNTCQIFKKEVEISGTIQAIDMAGVPDEYNYQLAHRTLELRRELGMAVYASVLITNSGTGGSDSVIRSMDGVRNRVRQQTAQVDSTTTVLDEKLVNSLYRLIYAQGGEANFCVSTADQMTKFSELYKDKIRLAPSDRQRGVFVTKFLTDLGVEIDLIIDRWAFAGDLLMGDEKRLRLVPLRGRSWQALPLAKTGDAMRGMIVGEYTLEIRNAAQCFALATALTV